MKHTLKVYKDSALHAEYMKARFPANQTPRTFELEGHRWAYEFTSFDDSGDYDLLYRFTDESEPQEKPDNTELRDMFAGLAMQAVVRRFDGLSFGGGGAESRQYRELAEDAYHIADAMLKARGQ